MTTPTDAPAPESLFGGDRGVLPLDARKALVLLLKSTHVAARTHPGEWEALLTHRARIGEVLNELFLVLEVDERAGVAHKAQADDDAAATFTTVLTQRPLHPTELRILMRLRDLLFEAGSTGQPVTVRGRDLLDHLADAYPDDRGDHVAARADDRSALRRLAGDDILVPARGTAADDPEDVEYTISTIVEVIMHPDRMAQYAAVLRADAAGEAVDETDDPDDAADPEATPADDTAPDHVDEPDPNQGTLAIAAREPATEPEGAAPEGDTETAPQTTTEEDAR